MGGIGWNTRSLDYGLHVKAGNKGIIFGESNAECFGVGSLLDSFSTCASFAGITEQLTLVACMLLALGVPAFRAD